MIFKILRYSGLPFFFREVLQRNRVTILLFHDMPKSTAEKALRYLKQEYNIIRLEDYLEAVEMRDASRLPKKSLIITFDDGHIRNYELLPVIRELGIPITIFLCAGIVGTNRHFWANYATDELPIPKLKTMSNRERIRVLNEVGFEQEQEFNTSQALSKQQINEMNELVNFQSHTLFHPSLPRCSDLEAYKEIVMAKETLEKDFGLKVNAISYPIGNYSNRDIEIARQSGHQCGVTVDYGFNTIDSDPFRMKRISANDTDNIDELVVKSSGLWAYLNSLLASRKLDYGFDPDPER